MCLTNGVSAQYLFSIFNCPISYDHVSFIRSISSLGKTKDLTCRSNLADEDLLWDPMDVSFIF